MSIVSGAGEGSASALLITSGGRDPIPAAVEERLQRVSSDGSRVPNTRWVASEIPVGIEINGFGYAVLLASPGDLGDLAMGFVLSERLIDHPRELLDIDIFHREQDAILRLTLDDHHAARLRDRVRHRATDSSCGLCGIDNIDQVLRPLPQVTASTHADDRAIFRAVRALEERQQLNRLTHAVHGAALCGPTGDIRNLREDVGRHNAFDKLIGAMARAGDSWDGGFALLTSRCSFELVEKAVLAGCPMLATISAPTTLALSRARSAGLSLKVLTRSDALLDCAAD